MNKPNLLADEGIVGVQQLYAPLTHLRTMPGRHMNNQHLHQAEALVIRSTTKVTPALLASSQVKFVGTCGAGVDHLDIDYLTSQNITWANAAGCNAQSVCDYVICAINHAWHIAGVDPRSAVIGVVGAGNVGGHLIRRLQKAGLKVVCSDPPQQNTHPQVDFKYVALQDLVKQANIICLHTPLTKIGTAPTYHLFDQPLLQALQPNSVIISAGRGEVVDQTALLNRLERHQDLHVYLDVWAHEPNIDLQIMPYCRLVTPHIAGHSILAKIRGSTMVYEAFCNFFGLDALDLVGSNLTGHDFEKINAAGLMPTQVKQIYVNPDTSTQELLNSACNSVYNLAQDAQRCTYQLAKAEQVGLVFDRLRNQYPPRHEFSSLVIRGISDPQQQNFMRGLGFQLDD